MSVHKSVYSILNGLGRNIFLARSAYTIEEIDATLERAEKLEADFLALCDRCNALQAGMRWFELLDDERELHHLCVEGDSFQLSALNYHTNEPFPVKTWQRILNKQERHNARIEKALKGFENAKQTA